MYPQQNPDEDRALAAVLLTLAIAAVGMAIMAFMLAPTPARALACQERPDGRTYWTYRVVDGQRCWYRGHRVLPKSSLHWTDGDEARPRRIKLDPALPIRAEAIEDAPPEGPARSQGRVSGHDSRPAEVLPECCWPNLTEFDLRWAGEGWQ